MKPIRKAVIPLAGHGVRMLPATRAVRKALFPIVDVRGRVCPVLQLIIEEAVNAGIEEIGLVIAPEDEALIRAYFSRLPGPLKSVIGNRADLLAAAESPGALSEKLTFITQDRPRGFGDAALRAKAWIGGDPVLVMLGDHLYLSGEDRCCARQLLDAYAELQAPVSGVIRKSVDEISRFGTVSGRPVPRWNGLYELDTAVEKPEPDLAWERLRVEGMPADTYLCWFGLHAMTPDIFDCLARMEGGGTMDNGELQLTGAQAMLATQRAYFALEINGDHFDTGSPEGYVEAVAAFAGPTGISNHRKEC
ncbi:MAG: nucleotidyl transferase [Gemmatimonadetes bacterium]|nr:nucleotidyl transferase [Gemmatimonadota bacterium]MYB61252.1 nucleotidyl transferase [Gemmatimonadota bacterium]